ncbi:imidazole glycerol phosphate synthase HisHF [Clavulina sp. PMI_390]|nr:imidazole glycerol phosphate synthase HisHF [Clavulina sp. PMI_390]
MSTTNDKRENKTKLFLLDYGAGNVRSLANALTELGYEYEWIKEAADFERADKLIFPGVGAFETAVVNLTQKGLFEPLRAYIASGRPYFGICIGMQVLFTRSSEAPAPAAAAANSPKRMRALRLGIIDTEIAEFDNAGKPVPHMGWNSREETGIDASEDVPGAGSGATYYFVHSYRAAYVPPTWGHTTTQYGREVFLATVRRGNVFACQFHPEKSGKAGLKVLKSWLDAPIQSVSSAPTTLAPNPEASATSALMAAAASAPSTTPGTLVRPKRLMRIHEMDGFTKRIIACMDVRANDDGDLVVTKGDQYDVREKDDAVTSTLSDQGNGSAAPGSPKRKVRNLGKPVALALRYYESGADEICLLNITSFRSSPLHDQPMLSVVREAASRIFVPLTIGGGIKDTADPDGTRRSALEVAGAYFRAGADKVSIGSEAVLAVERLMRDGLGGVPDGTSPIETIARVYGRQAVVVSVDPKKIYVPAGSYNAETGAYEGPYADEIVRAGKGRGSLVDARAEDEGRAWYYACTIRGGRTLRPLSVKQLVQGAEALGAGEILVNSIDRDGTNAGFDLDLVDLVRRSVRIPVVASSGAGKAAHFVDVFERTGVEAALAAGIFHRKEVELKEVKELCRTRGVIVRSAL